MTTIRYIGDVHAKQTEYDSIIANVSDSVQVGDFGIGFGATLSRNPRHRAIRGNHDNPSLIRAYPNWIPDGTIEADVFYLGGALSVDQHLRTEGVDWWRDEECSMRQLTEIMDKIDCHPTKINRVVTHDCPSIVVEELHGYGSHKRFPSLTSQFLDWVLLELKPSLWIFGHHHKELDKTINGCRFICLPELAYIDI